MNPMGVSFPFPMMHRPPMFFPALAGALVLWAVLVAISVLVLRWVWNLTLPQLFHLPEISFWQAFRLLVIAAILLGGLRFGFGAMRPGLTRPGYWGTW